MKNIGVLILGLTIASCGDSQVEPAKQTNEFLSARVIDSTIRQLEETEWARASVQKDTQWFHSHIADELVLTTGRTGELTNKEQTIAEIKDPSYGSGSADTIEDLKITSFENTAVATFRIITSGKDKTGPYSRTARYTEVWIFRDARWQLFASHSSLMPDGMKSKDSIPTK